MVPIDRLDLTSANLKTEQYYRGPIYIHYDHIIILFLCVNRRGVKYIMQSYRESETCDQ